MREHTGNELLEQTRLALLMPMPRHAVPSESDPEWIQDEHKRIDAALMLLEGRFPQWRASRRVER